MAHPVLKRVAKPFGRHNPYRPARRPGAARSTEELARDRIETLRRRVRSETIWTLADA